MHGHPVPSDHVAAERMDVEAKRQIVKKEAVSTGWICLDIGPETIARFSEEIRPAKRIFWNGPMGVFEMEPFSQGTFAVAQAMGRAQALAWWAGETLWRRSIGRGWPKRSAISRREVEHPSNLSTGKSYPVSRR